MAAAVFEQSRLSRHKKIVEEIKNVSRGKLFEVVDDTPVASRSCRNSRCRDFALRIYQSNSNLQSHGLCPRLLKEGQSLAFQHPNLIKLYGIDIVFSCNNFVYERCQRAELLVLSELASGNLSHWMQSHHRLKAAPRDVIKLAFDVLQGLDYLHRHLLVHRRLTPQNVLMVELPVSENKQTHFEAKLGDFQDMSLYYTGAKADEPLPLQSNQARYTAPELLEGYEYYEPSADMWSFGIVLFELVFGHGVTPFYDPDEGSGWFTTPEKVQVKKNVYEWLGSPEPDWRLKYTAAHSIDTQIEPHRGRSIKEVVMTSHAQSSRRKKRGDQNQQRHLGLGPTVFKLTLELIDQCLRIDPEQRITTADALRHPLFLHFSLTPVRGKVEFMPKPPPLPKGTFREVRRDLIRTTVRDLEGGYMQFYPALVALNLFDRSHVFFTQDIFENSVDGAVDRPLLYNLFCACYLMGLKLVVEWPCPAPDLFKSLKGLVCGATEDQRLSILFLERTIAKRLEFKFYIDEIIALPMDLEIFHRALNKPLFPEKIMK